MTMKIPFSRPSMDTAEPAAVKRVLLSGWLAAGPEVEAFEQEFSDYISPKGEHYYCIFTNSCTSALKMAYKWAKEKGLIYITYPLNTFCATYSAAEEMGLATTADGVERVFRDSRVNMHYGGVKDETPCLIEDSAHRIEPNDPLVGKIRCYSFYATKNMTTGSGGMFVTNDKDIYERARLYWRDGLSTSTADRMRGKLGYTVECMAGGYDGNDIAAAIGRVQLGKLPQFTERRNDIRDRYNTALDQDWQGNHFYPFTTPHYKELLEYLPTKGIGVSYFYPGTGGENVFLPIYPLLTNEEVDYIIQEVKDYVARI